MLTFVEFEGVPPSNNRAEREVRPAVLMRKASYGSQSERGAATRGGDAGRPDERVSDPKEPGPGPAANDPRRPARLRDNRNAVALSAAGKRVAIGDGLDPRTREPVRTAVWDLDRDALRVEVKPSLTRAADGQFTMTVNGVYVFDPTTGEVRTGGTDYVACWFVDTDYDRQSFFVRHTYFCRGGKAGTNGPYEKLKKALRAEVDEATWAELYGTTSVLFPRPASCKVAVKVINHFGDEVLKVLPVGR